MRGVVIGLVLALGMGAHASWEVLDVVKGSRDISPEEHEARRKADQQLKVDIPAFNELKGSLKPEDAAAAWLALYDRAFCGREGSGYEWGNFYLDDLLVVIPPPSAWPALDQLVRARRVDGKAEVACEAVLRMVVSRLVGDSAGLMRTVMDFESSFPELSKQEGVAGELRDLYLYLLPPISKFAGTEAEVLEWILDYFGAHPLEQSEWLEIPDLVELVGRDKAAALLKKALVLPNLFLDVPSGSETARLMKELMVSEMHQLGTPQWEMIAAADDVALYESMERRFPRKVWDDEGELVFDYQRQEALTFYLLRLVSTGRRTQALEYVLALEPESLPQCFALDMMVHYASFAALEQLQLFYEDVLRQRPHAYMEEGVLTCALMLGRSDRATAEMRRIAAAKKSESEGGMAARTRLISLLLAVDDVPAALKVYDELFRVDAGNLSEDALETLVDVGMSAVELGGVLEDETLFKAGLERTLSALPLGEFEAEQEHESLVKLLLEMKRYNEAEALCLERLEASKKTAYSRRCPDALGALLSIYNARGEFGKSVELLETSPYWGVGDLAGLNHGDSENELYEAAYALHAVGRGEESMRLVEYHLYLNPAHDAAYRLLLDLKGADALPLLDLMVERDRFEERPLIWKAVLLQEQGKLEEAEKTIRAALAVDPTDGEQRAGDRVRAYAVLSEILAARGDAKEAAFFADVVESVRVAERGDALHEAGLITRGLKAYEQAEVLFADAYCVQWRLGERLYSMGRVEEARTHYELAFKYLPEQFGRSASFCLGCAGVFSSEHTQGIAEEVLLALEKEDPNNPRVQYLLGSLRRSQQRPREAFVHFRRAVELDPEYLDAWASLYWASGRVGMPAAERDDIMFKLLELDPLRHKRMSGDKVADLAGLWSALERAEKYHVPVPKTLYPLPASRGYTPDGRPENILTRMLVLSRIGSLLSEIVTEY